MEEQKIPIERKELNADIALTKDVKEKIAVKKKHLLKVLAQENVAGNILYACRLLGIDRSIVYDWQATDKAFVTKLEEARATGKDKLADIAENALLKGIVDKQNPTLIIFALKNTRPKDWSDRIEHTGKEGQALFGVLQDANAFEMLFRVHELAAKRMKEKAEQK